MVSTNNETSFKDTKTKKKRTLGIQHLHTIYDSSLIYDVFQKEWYAKFYKILFPLQKKKPKRDDNDNYLIYAENYAQYNLENCIFYFSQYYQPRPQMLP